MPITDQCEYHRLYDTIANPTRLRSKIKRTLLTIMKGGGYSNTDGFENFFKQTVRIDLHNFKKFKPATFVSIGMVHQRDRFTEVTTKENYNRRKKNQELYAKFQNGIFKSYMIYSKINDVNVPLWKPVHPNQIIPGLYELQQQKTVNNICILIGESNYSTNDDLHAAHALCAFKHYDVLFCFNPWGEASLQSDYLIWNRLKKKYKCKRLVVYKGWNFQAVGRNDVGACFGYASNFGTMMYAYIMLYNLYARQGVRWMPLPTNIDEFNKFVLNMFKYNKLVFGKKYNQNAPLRSTHDIFHNLTHTPRLTMQKKNRRPSSNRNPITSTSTMKRTVSTVSNNIINMRRKRMKRIGSNRVTNMDIN